MRYILTGIVGLFLCTTTFATETDVLKWGPSKHYGASIVTATSHKGLYYRLAAGGHTLSMDADTQEMWRLMPGITAVPVKCRTMLLRGAKHHGIDVMVATITTPTATTKTSGRYSGMVNQQVRQHRNFSVGPDSPNTSTSVYNNVNCGVISVMFVPKTTELALALAAQNAVLTDRAIALARESGHAKGELRGVTTRPLVVINNDNSSGALTNAHAHTGGGVAVAAAQPLTRLCAYRWKCGTYFSDQFGRRWRRIAGVSLKGSTPGSFMGRLNGNRFTTGNHTFLLQ